MYAISLSFFARKQSKKILARIHTILICSTISAALIGISSHNTHAQLTENDTLRFGYKAATTGSWITGNVERLLINTSVDISHVGKHIGLKTSNTYTYGTIFNHETENDFFSRNFIYLSPSKKIYPYLMWWMQNSRRQRIEFRNQVGIGLSYSLLRSAHHTLKVSGTITREETRYQGTSFFIAPENLEGNEVNNWRATMRIIGQHPVFNKKLKISYESWYQPALNDSENWRYYLHAALDFPVARYVSLRATINYTHDNIVLTAIKRDDKFVTFGLTFGNY